ncbi:putative cellulase [Scytonema sp. HK-05]|uniref:cellulase family glycosylhydrolase n=1 Tax=Scytonema sp. HK-05 TaxID=1137095 RepID=UPI00093726D8|nr:cellulase family glycosylhydrolase [Scytonema sp. HK-05]OKH60452.1 glycoside hydrolase [Scytonema sp. HK-05]BAY44749.1 putative cellulase [Scytonema sp. HK-05]
MRYIHKKKRKKLKFSNQFFIFSVVIVVFIMGIVAMPARSQVNVVDAEMTMELPLSTRGAKILDAKGQQVLLRGVNWFGIETETHVPHGLWKRDYKEILGQIKSLGYNLIRLPYSLEALRSPNVNGIDFSIGSNKELEGKTPIQVMDLIIQEAQRQGLLVLLDNHRLSDRRISELWYEDGFTEADWIDSWKMLAYRYKNQTNVIGADLKNEPHGKAGWGTNDLATDWRLAAERAGNAILDVNPNWLIVVEGVEKNVPTQKLPKHWQGGNLEGVKRYPIRLSRRNKLVYSPHEYGPRVADQPWFWERKFPKNLIARWQIGFHYISSQNIAPIFIGEFGGREVDTNSKEGIWQNEFVKYIKQKKLSFAYWSWNPNSADTGGILLDDWLSIDIPKQQLLSQLLPVNFSQVAPVQTSGGVGQVGEVRGEINSKFKIQNSKLGVSSSSPSLPHSLTPSSPLSPSLPHSLTPSSSPSPSSPSSGSRISSSSSQLTVTSDIYTNWQTGFCVSFKIMNQSNAKVNDWLMTFSMKQAAINNSWNGNFKPQGGTQYVVTPLDWGRVVEPNQVRDFGFCANKLGSDYQPTQVRVNSQR